MDDRKVELLFEFSDGDRTLRVWGTGPGADEVNPETELVVPLTEELPQHLERDSQGKVQFDGETSIGLFASRLPDGRTATFAFTSVDEMLAWKPEGGSWVAIPMADLMELISNTHELVWINSAGESVVVEEVR